MEESKKSNKKYIIVLIVAIAVFVATQFLMNYLEIYGIGIIDVLAVLWTISIFSAVCAVLSARKSNKMKSATFLSILVTIAAVVSFAISILWMGNWVIEYDTYNCRYFGCHNMAVYATREKPIMECFCEEHKEHVYCALEGYCPDNYGKEYKPVETTHDCYICGEDADLKYGSYYYCDYHWAMVKTMDEAY